MKNLAKLAIDEGFRVIYKGPDCPCEGGEGYVLSQTELAERMHEADSCGHEQAALQKAVSEGIQEYDAARTDYVAGDKVVFVNGVVARAFLDDSGCVQWETVSKPIQCEGKPVETYALPVESVPPKVVPVVDKMPAPYIIDEAPVIDHGEEAVCINPDDYFVTGFDVGLEGVARVQPTQPEGREGFDYVKRPVSIDGKTQDMYLVASPELVEKGERLVWNYSEIVTDFKLDTQSCGMVATNIPALWGSGRKEVGGNGGVDVADNGQDKNGAGTGDGNAGV